MAGLAGLAVWETGSGRAGGVPVAAWASLAGAADAADSVEGAVAAVCTVLADFGLDLMTAAGVFAACALLALVAGLLVRGRRRS